MSRVLGVVVIRTVHSALRRTAARSAMMRSIADAWACGVVTTMIEIATIPTI